MILFLYLFVLIVLVVATFIAYFRPTTPGWLKVLLLLITIAVGLLPLVIWTYITLVDFFA